MHCSVLRASLLPLDAESAANTEKKELGKDDLKALTCPWCPELKEFSRKDSLQRHFENCHPGGRKFKEKPSTKKPTQTWSLCKKPFNGGVCNKLALTDDERRPDKLKAHARKAPNSCKKYDRKTRYKRFSAYAWIVAQVWEVMRKSRSVGNVVLPSAAEWTLADYDTAFLQGNKLDPNPVIKSIEVALRPHPREVLLHMQGLPWRSAGNSDSDEEDSDSDEEEEYPFSGPRVYPCPDWGLNDRGYLRSVTFVPFVDAKTEVCLKLDEPAPEEVPFREHEMETRTVPFAFLNQKYENSPGEHVLNVRVLELRGIWVAPAGSLTFKARRQIEIGNKGRMSRSICGSECPNDACKELIRELCPGAPCSSSSSSTISSSSKRKQAGLGENMHAPPKRRKVRRD